MPQGLREGRSSLVMSSMILVFFFLKLSFHKFKTYPRNISGSDRYFEDETGDTLNDLH